MHRYASVTTEKNTCGAGDIGVLRGRKRSVDRTEMGDKLWTVYPEPCDYVAYTSIPLTVKQKNKTKQGAPGCFRW